MMHWAFPTADSYAAPDVNGAALGNPTLDGSAHVPYATVVSAQICKLCLNKAVTPLNRKLVMLIEKSE